MVTCINGKYIYYTAGKLSFKALPGVLYNRKNMDDFISCISHPVKEYLIGV
jgi:hypothetical protein